MTRNRHRATVRSRGSRPRRRGLVLLAAGVIALLVAGVIAVEVARDFARRTQVTPAYEHLQRFQALADEHGDRATGTTGYEAAARYVEEQLAQAGYETMRQYFTFERRGEEYESFNVIAETDEGSDEEVIMLGAHLDGVQGSPAINDNASGVAALLVAAREVSQLDGIAHKVRFVWWGAEEFPRSYGSRHYVNALAENDEEALQDIAAYLNVDMVASPNPVIGVYNARETAPNLDVPEGSVEIMRFLADYFDTQDQPWVPTEWDYNSDQVAFIRKDVPVGGLFTGSDEKKSGREAGLFGGQADAPRDPNYHSPGDDIDNVDPETLELMTEAITHAATTLAVDSSALRQRRPES